MSDSVRLLNEAGVARFREYLVTLRDAPATPPPSHLLVDPLFTISADFSASIAKVSFRDRFEFGKYLVDAFAAVNRTKISREHRLWSWLALYYFDQLCPSDAAGVRRPLQVEAYILDPQFGYKSYYRHLVRTPWLAVSLHPVTSRVILTPIGDVAAPLAQRGELIEQIASRQSLFRSSAVMATAYGLYFDSKTEKVKKGSAGSGEGSPRRLAAILNQLDLTFDLEWGSSEELLGRLPKEFARWRKL